MDGLAEVTRLTEKFEDAKANYEAAMEARNQAIRKARANRYGPGILGKITGLTPEQVRRICVGQPRTGTSGRSSKSTTRK